MGASRVRLRAFSAALTALAALTAGGCVAKPALVVDSYTIDPPPRAATAPGAGGRLLVLEAVAVAPTYSGRLFVYRTGDHRVEKDAYAQFTAPPAWLLTAAIRGYLQNADFVQDVVSPGGVVHADARIDAEVLDLYGDLDGAGAAVLTMQFRVVRTGSGTVPAAERMRRTYTQRIPLAQRTPAALVDGWSRALGEIMVQFIADLKGVLAAAPAA